MRSRRMGGFWGELRRLVIGSAQSFPGIAIGPRHGKAMDTPHLRSERLCTLERGFFSGFCQRIRRNSCNVALHLVSIGWLRAVINRILFINWFWHRLY